MCAIVPCLRVSFRLMVDQSMEVAVPEIPSAIVETSNVMKDTTTVDTTTNVDTSESDSEQHACNGVTTPHQSTSELKHIDNSIFNTISKIVNRTAKVCRCHL